jgi:hypothetical protein
MNLSIGSGETNDFYRIKGSLLQGRPCYVHTMFVTNSPSIYLNNKQCI